MTLSRAPGARPCQVADVPFDNIVIEKRLLVCRQAAFPVVCADRVREAHPLKKCPCLRAPDDQCIRSCDTNSPSGILEALAFNYPLKEDYEEELLDKSQLYSTNGDNAPCRLYGVVDGI